MQLAPLHSTTRKNQVQELLQLLQTCKDVNARSDEGYTALHYVTRIGHQKAIASVISL